MDHGTVQEWLDRYVEAWRTYDAAAIGDLFTDDAAYRYHAWDEPLHGRDAIVADWLANRDAPAHGRRPTRHTWSRPITPSPPAPPATTTARASVNITTCSCSSSGRMSV